MSDHKAEAQVLINFAAGNGSESASMAAVAHATLYAAEQTAELVKQQRIANLIAYTEALAENERDGYVLNKAGRARRDAIEVQIVEGLALS